MPQMIDAQLIESFHLAFLHLLQRQLDPARYVLKGGANLRYFFESVRYSEDIDIDLVGVEPWLVTKKVDDLLGSPAMGIILRSSGLAVSEFSKPKQTPTTRRWKVSVDAPGHSHPIRTKIEFSNRSGEGRYKLEAVPSRVVEPYALASPKVQHYTGEAATEQKIRALAGRTQTQARDVFDLDLLLRSQSLEPGAVEAQVLEDAAERALELPFDAFRDQVLPFLEPDIADFYDAGAWEQMQLLVAEKLGGAR